MMSARKYRELFRLRAEGKLETMECTKRLYKLMKPLYFPGMTVLDMPCGAGHYFRKLRKLGNIDYTGVDLDNEAIAIAKEIFPREKFDVMDANMLAFDDNSFDVVICYNLLLHLPDYKKALSEMFRVSRRYIIIRSLFAKNGQHKKFRAAKDYGKVYDEGTIFYNTYSKSDVLKFVHSLGKCKAEFIPDNANICRVTLAKQIKATGIDKKEFTACRNGIETWKGIRLNYEVLFIEKARLK